MHFTTVINLYPKLYHMAERDTWAAIKGRGLLSTSATLDRYGISGPRRDALEEEHRPNKVRIGDADDYVVLRDQRPMPPSRLQIALANSGMTPQEWYRLLNGKVFFWAEEERLFRLLKAEMYGHL